MIVGIYSVVQLTRKDHERARRMSLIRLLPNVVRRSIYSSSLVRALLKVESVGARIRIIMWRIIVAHGERRGINKRKKFVDDSSF